MTRGRVDLKVVEDRLQILATCVDGLRRLPTSSIEDFRSDFRNQAAADSLLRRAIEALFDALRHVLAKSFGLAPLEYREVAKLAGEKNLVTDQQLRARMREIAGFRNRLTHFYDEVTTEEPFAVTRDELGDLEALASQVRAAARTLAEPG